MGADTKSGPIEAQDRYRDGRGRGAAPPVPTRELERAWQVRGCRLVAGVDEVGRGPLAGPVAAGAVILPPTWDPPWLGELRDSKQLSAPRREALAERIRTEALAFGVGVIQARRIDEVGIAMAAREAMCAALAMLSRTPEALLLDAFRLPEAELPQEAIIGGDARCSCIAAASIVAKVARDRIMAGIDRRFSGYGFARNRGYGTAEHLTALRRLGPSPIHRRSFAPVRELAGP